MFDRINLDPKIQIKYVDTKHQLADMLTKGNFTRDEWNNLLQLFNVRHVSLIFCSQNVSFDQLHGSDGENDARTERRREYCDKVKADVEPDRTCLNKLFDSAKSDCVEKPRDTQGILSK